MPLLFRGMEKRKKIEIAYVIRSLAGMNEADQHLIEKAKDARLKAYSPYSNFQVGAAVLLEDSQILTGSNQENRAFPSGLCAERVCLFHASSAYPDMKIRKLAVVAFHRGSERAELSHPCGGCRQVMAEMEWKQKQPFQLFLLYPNEEVLVLERASDLLPFPFEAEL